MKLITSLVLSFAILAPAVADAQNRARSTAKPGTAQKKIYCWEQDGQRVCGDTLPPSASNAARTEMNARTGNVTRSVERSLTPQERAEAEKLLREGAAKAQQQETLTQQGHALLMSYGSEAALNLAFDERVEAVEASIKGAEKQKRDTQVVLADRLSNLANMELSGKSIPKVSRETVMRLREQVMEHDGIINGHLAHIARIESERQQSLTLYRTTLQNLSTSASTP